jgi:ferredoxin
MPKIVYKTAEKIVDAPYDPDLGETAKNILSTSIRYGGELPYRCGGGLCGTCMMQITEGTENILPAKEREIKFLQKKLGEKYHENYRLGCQTFTTGDCTIEWEPKEAHAFKK